ncbi:MAG: NADH-quinone oxidoreductase subunit J [Rhodobacteraceae bacterium]|nr:NADH-quinone oxidoreductase subunit J [Paracoccaceae bacterium]
MSLIELAFYGFSGVAVFAAFSVVLARNPVHAVLFLILTFLSTAGLFVLMGAEFIAMLLIIVYVGAVAVLFLFVVMMLDVDFAELKAGMARYIPVGLLIGVVLLMALGIQYTTWETSPEAAALRQNETPDMSEVQNSVALGRLIYTKYIFGFQAAGLILLVAMIGAIVLTHRRRTNVKRQDIVAQIYRDPDAAIELRDVKPGSGTE